MNKCSVLKAWLPNSGLPEPPVVEFDAVWDTGATGSVITQAVVDAYELVATGITKVCTVDGEAFQETYLVNIKLPNRVGYSGVRVTKGDLGGGIGMLIGMNIMNTGDFAISNHNGVIKFYYRVPSLAHIDFSQQPPKPRFQHGGKSEERRSSYPLRIPSELKPLELLRKIVPSFRAIAVPGPDLNLCRNPCNKL